MNFYRFDDICYTCFQAGQLIRTQMAGYSEDIPIPDFIRIEIRIREMDILQCFHKATDPVKVFWSDRNGKMTGAGIGSAVLYRDTAENPMDVLSLVEKQLCQVPTGTRFYGGFCFDPDTCSPEWESFGKQIFFIPRIEIFRENFGFMLVCHFRKGKNGNRLFPQSVNVCGNLPK